MSVEAPVFKTRTHSVFICGAKGCGNETEMYATSSQEVAERWARLDGWLIHAEDFAKDRCPECRALGELP